MSHINTREMNGRNVETRDFAPHSIRCSWETGDTYTPRSAMVVHFGLHYLSGNSSPYFSVTCNGYDYDANGRRVGDWGGAAHDTIAAQVPELADMIALHLSDMDGAPMHAESNGFYWLSGYLGIAGEYGPTTGSFPKTEAECFRLFCDHMRITEKQAANVAGDVMRAYRGGRGRGALTGTHNKAAAKATFNEFCEAQRTRWKREALAAVKRWELGIYGAMQKTHSETVAMLEGN